MPSSSNSCSVKIKCLSERNSRSIFQHKTKSNFLCLALASNPEGSIKSQEQRLRQHVEFKNLDSNFGSITSIFIDRGKSGKNTNRPELQRLLKAIREKEINFVLVTELSRLSRSIKDFSEIW
ncbi:MAG: recombinase family protein, partial [Chitinophagia bacterium]|nr:recombinase family protein [Chitinophagia bacterium]